MLTSRLLPIGLTLTTIVVACSPAPPPRPLPAPSGSAVATPRRDSSLDKALAEASAGVTDPSLAALLREHWSWTLEQDPIYATRLGVHAFDDRIADNSAAAIEARRARSRELLARAEGMDGSKLNPADQMTLALFIEQLGGEIATFVCESETWSLSPRNNPVTEWNYLQELHKVATVSQGEQLVSRYRLIAGSIDNDVANLKRGAARGLFATAESTRRVIEMVHKQLAEQLVDWPMLVPAAKPHPEWPVARLERYRRDLNDVLGSQIKPALARYARFLESEIMPHARDGDHSGLAALPVGRACYAAAIGEFTGLPLTAEQIHTIGLEEIARIDTALADLGRKAFGADGLPATLDKLRSDASLYFETEQQVLEAAQRSLDLAKGKMQQFFGILPKADCVIRRIPDYEAPYTTIAYYRPPHPDGSKPGEYYVNVFKPKTRPRFEARVLAVHESIPGHHLQIAIAQEREALPAFRKHGRFTAFVEGWALYTERLADEMGLYEHDLDRIGMLSFDAWRAGRLVVDTGIHALGWSRERAKRFFEAHSALSHDNIDNEVDRYITWPGQALAYKLGQLEIHKLRAEAQAKLGERFKLPDFHDAVLAGGAVPLPLLRERLQAYLAR